MSLWKRIARSNFFIRARSWEYWPFGIIQFPAMIYWLWLSARARSLVFFSASNPGIPMGGMFGESKFDILKQIPERYVPRTLLVHLPSSVAEVRSRMCDAGIDLPVILKPDIGERGFMVTKVSNDQEIADFLRRIKCDFLVQEWISLPLEFGVFYLRFPSDKNGQVISLTGKEMLSVTGDGVSNLKQLILASDRAKLQWSNLRVTYCQRLHEIIAEEEKLVLVPMGNHSRGARFINCNALINETLSRAIDGIAKKVPGFYFGRFDLRCASLDDLYQGKVKILELNGCGAEPGHMYDSGFSLWQALKLPVRYWSYIYAIARTNKKCGVKYVSHRAALRYYRRYRSAVQ